MGDAEEFRCCTWHRQFTERATKVVYHRVFQVDDFPRCLPLLPSGFKAPAYVREALPSIWARLFEARQLLGGVVVDREGNQPDDILAFGMTVFVDPALIDEYLRAPEPYISARVYERVLGGRSPVLPAGAIATANAAGTLNLLILHFGMRPSRSEMPTPRELAVVAKAQTGFRLSHEGYHVQRVIQEVYGPAQVAIMQAGGVRLQHDFSVDTEYARELSQAEWPYLMAVTRDDPESRLPGSAISCLFQRARPRFRFAPAEQRVLMRTLLDETDDTIAAVLRVSRDAVKKTWRRIYQRVAAVDPMLLDGGAERPDSDDVRGREKRQRLIRYLRYHLEELRPFKESRGRTRHAVTRQLR